MKEKICYERLTNININDNFFESLKNDYKNFEKWFLMKRDKDYSAYVLKDDNNKLKAFLLLKIEDEQENYTNFKIPFDKQKRLKICTFKIQLKGKGIASEFLKIITNEARKNNATEIYICILKKYNDLINFFLKNNFVIKTINKKTVNHDEEYILVKNIKAYDVLLPIKPKYVQKIFNKEKRYEFRKRIGNKDIKNIIIYETSPVKKVVGEVPVLDIICDTPENIWKKTHQHAGINKDDFYKYFKQSQKGYAYVLGDAIKYKKKLLLSDIGINFYPQSFVYLNDKNIINFECLNK